MTNMEIAGRIHVLFGQIGISLLEIQVEKKYHKLLNNFSQNKLTLYFVEDLSEFHRQYPRNHPVLQPSLSSPPAVRPAPGRSKLRLEPVISVSVYQRTSCRKQNS